MATAAAMAIRDQLARERIDTALAGLADRHGIEVPAVPFVRDPVLARVVQLEAFASVFESLVDAKGGDPTSPAAEIVEDAADQGVALGVEVDQGGEAVLVTETVDGEVAENAASDAVYRGEAVGQHDAVYRGEEVGTINPVLTKPTPAPKKGRA